MYLDILHVFYTYPKRVQDTFGIHNRYIKIHVSCSLCWCHTGYISRYIRIRVSWTRAIRVPTCAPACPVCVLCVPAPPGVFFYHTELSVPNYQSVPRMCTVGRGRARPRTCASRLVCTQTHSCVTWCDAPYTVIQNGGYNPTPTAPCALCLAVPVSQCAPVARRVCRSPWLASLLMVIPRAYAVRTLRDAHLLHLVVSLSGPRSIIIRSC